MDFSCSFRPTSRTLQSSLRLLLSLIVCVLIAGTSTGDVSAQEIARIENGWQANGLPADDLSIEILPSSTGTIFYNWEVPAIESSELLELDIEASLLSDDELKKEPFGAGLLADQNVRRDKLATRRTQETTKRFATPEPQELDAGYDASLLEPMATADPIGTIGSLDDMPQLAMASYLAPDHSAFGGIAFITIPPDLSQDIVLESEENEENKEAKTESTASGSRSILSMSISELLKLVEKRKKEIADGQLDEEEMSDQLRQLTMASDVLLKAGNFQHAKSIYHSQIEEFEKGKRLDRLNFELANVAQAQVPIRSTDSEALEAELEERKMNLEDLKNQLEQIENQTKLRSDRITKIPVERAEALKQREKLHENLQLLQTQASDDEQAGSDLALSLILIRARMLRIDEELEALEAENLQQKPAGKTLPLRRDLVTRKIKTVSSEVENWELALTLKRQEDVQKQAQQAWQDASMAHPSLREFAKRNQDLTQFRGKITERVRRASQELSTVEDEWDAVSDKLKDLEREINDGGLTATNGMLLAASRQSMIKPGESFVRIRQIESEMQTVSIALIQLQDEREALADPTDYVKNTLGIDHDTKISYGNTRPDQLAKMALGFVEKRRQYLDDLVADYDQYKSHLKNIKVKRMGLIEEIAKLQDYIDTNALWIRSAKPIEIADLSRSSAAVQRIFTRDEWAPMVHGVKNRIASKPYESALGVCGLFALFIVTRRFKEKQK